MTPETIVLQQAVQNLQPCILCSWEGGWKDEEKVKYHEML